MSEAQQSRLRVECYAGYCDDEEPRRLYREREVFINAILDRWLVPEHRYFKVHGSDGATCL